MVGAKCVDCREKLPRFGGFLWHGSMSRGRQTITHSFAHNTRKGYPNSGGVVFRTKTSIPGQNRAGWKFKFNFHFILCFYFSPNIPITENARSKGPRASDNDLLHIGTTQPLTLLLWELEHVFAQRRRNC